MKNDSKKTFQVFLTLQDLDEIIKATLALSELGLLKPDSPAGSFEHTAKLIFISAALEHPDNPRFSETESFPWRPKNRKGSKS